MSVAAEGGARNQSVNREMDEEGHLPFSILYLTLVIFEGFDHQRRLRHI
jgi:hypothetical protein